MAKLWFSVPNCSVELTTKPEPVIEVFLFVILKQAVREYKIAKILILIYKDL